MKRIVKHFHLAFKGMDTSEIYDVLMALLVMTIKGYDPKYTDKLKLSVEVIDRELLRKEQFNFADVNKHLDFDCHRCIRLLGRLGYLKAVQEGKEKRISGFVRTETWPPPAKFFQSGPVGVAHYIQKWFRFKLQEWIVSRMREVESKEGFYSLEGWLDCGAKQRCREEGVGDHTYFREQVPSLMGKYQDATGAYLTADVSMIEKPLDISRITLEWVHETEDLLFKNLSQEDRYACWAAWATSEQYEKGRPGT